MILLDKFPTTIKYLDMSPPTQFKKTAAWPSPVQSWNHASWNMRKELGPFGPNSSNC